jgi:hypothetical protein
MLDKISALHQEIEKVTTASSIGRSGSVAY